MSCRIDVKSLQKAREAMHSSISKPHINDLCKLKNWCTLASLQPSHLVQPATMCSTYVQTERHLIIYTNLHRFQHDYKSLKQLMQE